MSQAGDRQVSEPGSGAGTAGRRRVVVIGGGLTGLAAAWHVREQFEVVVLEAAARAGGQIRTMPFAGAQLDMGADAFLARQPDGERLVRSVGFDDDDLVAPSTGQVHLWARGRLRPLPSGTVMGVPADLVALSRSGVLRPVALARAAVEPLLPRRHVVGDRSVADLVGERFGHDVVEQLVEPLLGGVYAGSAARLSAEAATAPVWEAARQQRSLFLGLRAHRARGADDRRPVFLTLRGGLDRLVQRLVDDLGSRLQLRTAATAVTREADGGRWRITTGTGDTLEADGIVLAVPPTAAARLLGSASAEAARELSGIRTASVGVVALAYDQPLGATVPFGSGILVPRTEERLIKAVTFTSRKWPHHAAQDRFLLRASVGRIDDDRALQRDDTALIAGVQAELREAVGLPGVATEALVQRWPDALPQYDVGHRARVDRLHAALRRDAPGLHLGGAVLDGLGLSARARDAGRLAHELRWDAGLIGSG